MSKNLTGLSIAKSVAREPYAWPGGYPRMLIMAACLTFKAQSKELS